MRLAVVADIHGNLQALEAVLSAIAAERVDRVVCLGDLVGYNANPRECVELVRDSAHIVIAGNHDRDTVANETPPVPGTSPEARLSQRWTRSRLDDGQTQYLRELPPLFVERGGFVAAHGCYLNDTFLYGYVTSTMLERNLRAVAGGVDWPPLAFCGHTHAPLCGWLDDEDVHETKLREPSSWPSSARAVLINPGSVGQPRDRDPRASFALVDPGKHRVEVKRVPYDVDSAARAVVEAGLPESFARRLFEGR